MYERATIIMEMEQSMLPLVTAFKRWHFFARYRYQQVRRKLFGGGVSRSCGDSRFSLEGTGEVKDTFLQSFKVIIC
jgi:hypothetical protein